MTVHTFDHLVGVTQELLDRDMGLGVDHPDYMDEVLANHVPDPINFDIGRGLVDQIDVEENEPQMGVGEVQEEAFQGNNNVQNVNLFAGVPLLDDIDQVGLLV